MRKYIFCQDCQKYLTLSKQYWNTANYHVYHYQLNEVIACYAAIFLYYINLLSLYCIDMCTK